MNATNRLAASPVFQDRLGEADAMLRAARALLHAEARCTWAKQRNHPNSANSSGCGCAPPVLMQHIGISRDAFGYVGALLAGEELDSTRPI